MNFVKKGGFSSSVECKQLRAALLEHCGWFACKPSRGQGAEPRRWVLAGLWSVGSPLVCLKSQRAGAFAWGGLARAGSASRTPRPASRAGIQGNRPGRTAGLHPPEPGSSARKPSRPGLPTSCPGGGELPARCAPQSPWSLPPVLRKRFCF